MRTLPAALLLLIVLAVPCHACLRDNADARAIQWSTLIVQAKLARIDDPVALAAPYSYRLYHFTVTQTLDGKPAGDDVTVLRMFSTQAAAGNSECGTLTPDAVGKSYVLLLHPEQDISMPGDPRNDAVHQLKTYTFVYLASADDLGADGITNLKQQITDTRQAEAAVNDADATLQAQTAATAADDTEEEQAQQALEQMGFKALPAIQKVYDAADSAGKSRLKDVISDLALPPMPVAQADAANP